MDQNLLGTALRFHQAGQFAEAQQLYRQMLAIEPNNADLHSLLGAACINLEQWGPAMTALSECLRLNPRHAAAHDNSGVLLGKQNRFAEAAESFQRAIAAAPDNGRTHLNLAGALQQLGRIPEAMAACREAARLSPNLAHAHQELGQWLLEAGQFGEAVLHFRHVVRLNPGDPGAHFHLAMALAGLGDLDAAIVSYRETVRLKPASAEACVNLGHLLMRKNQIDEAIEWLEYALRQRPNFAEAHINLGSALLRKKRLEDAARSLEQAVRLNPGLAQAHNNLGIVRTEQGLYDAAIGHYRDSLARRPDDAETVYNLATAVLKRGDVEAALGHFERAMQLRPDYAEAHHNHSAALLLLGKMEQGLPEYEWRFKSRDYPRLDLPKPRWDGSPLLGRDIVLVCEQGLGDTLQFIRYAALVKRSAGRVIVQCPAALQPILARTPGVDSWTVSAAEAEANCAVPLLSLPYYLRTTLATIPADVPYVFADPTLVAKWKDRLAELDGFKIGLAWQVNPKAPDAAFRSLPLARFRSLARIPGVQLISLQKGPGSEQVDEVASEFSVHDFGAELDAAGPFMDTAAIMQHLDLVISADTATAHLAGALGVRVWTAIQFLPDWRWLLQRDDTPWYPTMRLFRQTQVREWQSVIDQMTSALQFLVAGH